jgi:hypothetical protein
LIGRKSTKDRERQEGKETEYDDPGIGYERALAVLKSA